MPWQVRFKGLPGSSTNAYSSGVLQEGNLKDVTPKIGSLCYNRRALVPVFVVSRVGSFGHFTFKKCELYNKEQNMNYSAAFLFSFGPSPWQSHPV